jgi:hypothetical protein
MKKKLNYAVEFHQSKMKNIYKLTFFINKHTSADENFVLIEFTRQNKCLQ